MFERHVDLHRATKALTLRTICLVPALPEHAPYIYGLRTNRLLNTHLSPPPPSVDAQRQWLEAYKLREASGTEYYFLIQRLDGTPCGTVRLYDFRERSFCWGSWILDANKTRFAAIESALLVYRFGFEWLNFEASHFDVRKENQRVIDFHLRMGAQRTAESEIDYYFLLPRGEFEKRRESLLTMCANT